MAYLSKAEQAMLTQTNAAVIGIPAAAGSAVLGTVLGVAQNIIWADRAGDRILNMMSDIRTYSGFNISLAAKLSQQGLDKLVSSIETELENGFVGIFGLIHEGMLDTVGGMYGALRDTFSGASTLLNSYNGLIQSVGIDPFITRWVNDRVLPNIPNAQTTWFMHSIGQIDDDTYTQLTRQNGWNAEWMLKMWTIWRTPMSPEMLMTLRRRDRITEEGFSNLLKWGRYDDTEINLFTQLLIDYPEPYRMADMAAKELASDGELKQAFRWSGLDAHWAEMWRESQYVYPSIQALNELVWRGKIDRTIWGNWLLRQGYKGDVVNTLFGLTESLPSSNDLVTMVVREAFEPKYVVPAPSAFATEMAKKGFTQTWSDRYWTAHFLPMPIQYGYANLHRGYWTKEQFIELLRIADIHPDWREGIYNVAFNPPSIREMGYGYDVGAYTKEEIIKYRRWGGLSEVDAKKAGQAMVAYRTEAEREAVRREYLYLYVLGNFEADAFREALASIGTAAEAIPLWIERGDFQRIRKSTEAALNEPRTLTRADGQWLLEKGLRDEVWFKSILDNLGYDEESIDAYVDQSKQRSTDKSQSDTEAEREAVRREYLYLYVLGQIDTDAFRDALVSIGTAAEAVPLWIERGDFQRIRKSTEAALNEPRTLTRADAQWLFERGIRDEEWFTAVLENLSYDEESIQAYVDQSKQRIQDKVTAAEPKLVKYNELSRSDLADLWQFGYIKYADMVNRLVAYGYNEQDANFVGTLIRISVVFSNLKALYSKGWINSKDMFDELIRTGLSKEAVDNLMMITIKYSGGDRTVSEKDLTKAEIVKGVKNLVLTPIEGIQLLQNLGYDAGEAEYILIINKVIAAGDPTGYWDMRRATEAYKKARGEKYVTIPTELILLETKRKQLQTEISRLRESKATEEQLGLVAVQLAAVQANMQKIIVSLKLS